MHLPKSALLVVPFCLVVVACGGGKSAGKSAEEKATDAAAQAKAACEIFVHFHPPTETDHQSQVEYVKASYDAFLASAELASKATALDSKWKALESAAEREAAAYGVIAKATQGATQVDVAGVNAAVKEAKVARPIFLAECLKADPAHFQPVPPSPSSRSKSKSKAT